MPDTRRRLQVEFDLGEGVKLVESLGPDGSLWAIQKNFPGARFNDDRQMVTGLTTEQLRLIGDVAAFAENAEKRVE